MVGLCLGGHALPNQSQLTGGRIWGRLWYGVLPMRWLAVSLMALGATIGCDGGQQTATTPAAPPVTPPPPPPVFTAPPPSYELQYSQLRPDWGALRRELELYGSDAVAYGDFDGDGDEDVFVAPGMNTPDPKPVEMYLHEGAAGFRLSDEAFVGDTPRVILGRKAIPSDFNGDGRLDIFVAAHGYDAPPFAGEAPLLLLSTAAGRETTEGLDHVPGSCTGRRQPTLTTTATWILPSRTT